MKKVLFIPLVLLLFSSCEKEDDPGDLTITVSYFYNNFIGYKPDVGARAFLHENENVECPTLIDAVVGYAYIGEEKFECNYDAEADVNGQIRFNDIPGGTYYLIVKSKGRFTFSDKIIDIPPGGELDLVKNFGYRHEFEEEYW